MFPVLFLCTEYRVDLAVVLCSCCMEQELTAVHSLDTHAPFSCHDERPGFPPQHSCSLTPWNPRNMISCLRQLAVNLHEGLIVSPVGSVEMTESQLVRSISLIRRKSM